MIGVVYSVFKDFYKTAMKPISVSDIVNGESVTIHPNNIVSDENVQFDDPTFETKLKFCNKTLFDYQKDGIKKIRELELRGYNKDMISNGWLLKFPIGSGKTIIFMFLCLFYRDVPAGPIIISTDGSSIPQNESLQPMYYPFYYENCGYVKNKCNAVVVYENYIQRKCSIILTHQHLLEQVRNYINEDFSKDILSPSKTKISIVSKIRDAAPDSNIIIVAATRENVTALVKMSHDQPFMRVVIDDFTSMSDIESFREILASSTLFVSGSGYDRKEDDIPAGYYTLKGVESDQLTIVGKPEKTFKGVFRDNIATLELVGSSCDFNWYKFVHDIDEMCKSEYGATSYDVYPNIATNAMLQDYIALAFIEQNVSRLKMAMSSVLQDLVECNPKTGKPRISNENVSYFLEWKESLNKIINVNDEAAIMRAKNGDNLLYNRLFNVVERNDKNGSPIVAQRCMNCGSEFTKHCGYGCVSVCCGAFYCSNCLKSMTTKLIEHDNICLENKTDYYCCCCRKKNPVFFTNTTRMKDTNISYTNFIKDNFDVSALKNHIDFDYAFYMLTNGFVPLYHDGVPLSIANDISQGSISVESFRDGNIPELENLLPKDQLAIQSLNMINASFKKVEINPGDGSSILIYGCPSNDMIQRVRDGFDNLIEHGEFEIVGRKKVSKQPIAKCNLIFKQAVSDLIGVHNNIIAIIQWNAPKENDEVSQLCGRILRLNTWNNKLYFYIVCNSLTRNVVVEEAVPSADIKHPNKIQNSNITLLPEVIENF
jgi:hypothetical protein